MTESFNLIHNKIKISRCPPQLYGLVAEIYNQYIEVGGYNMETNPKTLKDVENWVSGFGEREGLFICLDTAVGYPVGWAVVKAYSPRSGYRRTCETVVYLKSTELGKGYGTAIKLLLFQMCKAWNYHHLVAKIWATNKRSIDYNLKLGYEMVGTQKEVGWMDGKPIDVCILQKILK